MISGLQYSDENLIGGKTYKSAKLADQYCIMLVAFVLATWFFDVRTCVIICDRKTLC